MDCSNQYSLPKSMLTSTHCQRVCWTVLCRKKGGKQRLIVDARSVNARMRAPPGTPLATRESFSQFEVFLPELCDPHGGEAQIIHTYSSATVAS